MKAFNGLNKEKDFLLDSQKFYQHKRFRPEIRQIQSNYKSNRKNIAFELNDFLDNSGIDYNVANNIYLIGLAEYKTTLTFEQFLYYVFWNSESWDNSSRNRYYFSIRGIKRQNSEFRKPHKFKKSDKTRAKILSEKDLTKKEWRKYKKLDKDKSRGHGRRYSSYSKSLKAYAIRKERRYVKQKINQEKEADTKVSKIFFDNWYYD